MIHCPNCQKPIHINEEHFGTLFRCSHCQSEFFVDFSGVPENSKEPNQTDEIVQNDLSMTGYETSFEPVVNQVGLESSSADYLSPQQEMTGSFEEKYKSNESLPSDIPSEQLITTAGDGVDNGNYDQFWNSNTSSTTDDPPENQRLEKENFNEVQSFANDVKNYDGVLSFDLKIEGIDLPEQKIILLECLDDSRLGIEIEEVKKRLDSGSMEILGFPAAKTVVLVQRLQGQGFIMSWREHVSTQ